jgi:tRNA pseudouridine synthase 10
LKFSRTLSQTAWVIEGERKTQTSLEEIMGNILKNEISASSIYFILIIQLIYVLIFILIVLKAFIFSSSGREDIDVRCLGLGRPFVLEFIEPKRTEFTREELKTYQKVNFVIFIY